MTQKTDFFERLGLPRRFAIDRATLEREYLARSREIHPDFHAGDDEKTAATAKLNEAYLTLKEPFRRAEYYLKWLGGPSAYDDKSQDQAFLMEMMDLREMIALSARNETTDHLEQNKELQTIENDLRDRKDALLAAISKQFEAIESTPSANHTASLQVIRKHLNSAKTIDSLLRELNA